VPGVKLPGPDPTPASPLSRLPWPHLIDLLLISALIVAAFWRVIFEGAFFDTALRSWDWPNLAHPAYVYTGQSLMRGEFPLWNTHWFAGYPHLAVPNNSVLYPPTLLYGIFDFITAAKIVILGHIFLFAATSYLLGRDLYRSRFPAVFLGVCAVSGSTVSWPLSGGNLWTVTTIAWLPFAFMALRRVLHSGSAAWALALAPALACMALAGDPITFAFVLLSLGAYTAFMLTTESIARTAPWTMTLRNGALCAIAVAGGLALAAAQLLPSHEFIEESVRKDGVTYHYFWGNYTTTLFDTFEIATLYQLVPISYLAGKVTLGLSFAALAGHARREALALWTITILLWAFGDVSEWIFENVIRHLPVLGSIRGSTPFALVVIYISYVLAGFGLDTLIAGARPHSLRRAPWLIAVVISTVCLIVAAFRDPHFAASVVTVPALAAIAAAVFLKKIPHRAAALALFALVAGEAASRFSLEPYIGEPRIGGVENNLAAFSQSRADIDRILILGPTRTGIRQGPAVTLLTGDRNIEGYHALFLHRYARLLRDVAGVPIATLDAKGRLDAQGDYGPDWVNAAALPILDLFNVRYILRNRAVSSFIKSEIDAKSGRFSFEVHDGLRVYKNHAALPPVFPIHEIEYVPSDEAAIALLREGRFDYRKRATLSPGNVAPPLAPATGPEPITLKNYGPNSVEAHVSLTAPALLVLSEMWYPGWYAQVDGGPAQPVLCVDTALQATPVPAGNHTVRFFFRPRSFIIGAVISALAMLAWIASLLVIVFRRRRKPPGANQGPICID